MSTSYYNTSGSAEDQSLEIDTQNEWLGYALDFLCYKNDVYNFTDVSLFVFHLVYLYTRRMRVKVKFFLKDS